MCDVGPGDPGHATLRWPELRCIVPPYGWHYRLHTVPTPMLRILLRFAKARLSLLRERRRKAWVARLCSRGMRVGRNVVVMDDVSFDTTYPWLIDIEDGCRISTGVRILAHDATPLRDLGVSRLGRVRILKDSFIAERCVILPGVTIGPRAMIAAGSVVGRDIGEGVLAAGNPARVYGQYADYLNRIAASAADSHILDVRQLWDAPDEQARTLAAMGRGEQVLVRGIDADTSYFYNVSPSEVVQAAEVAYSRLVAGTASLEKLRDDSFAS